MRMWRAHSCICEIDDFGLPFLVVEMTGFIMPTGQELCSVGNSLVGLVSKKTKENPVKIQRLYIP